MVRIELYEGDILNILDILPNNHFDCLVTDPPYSSGGLFRVQRSQNPSKKYSRAKNREYMSFEGDSMDGRAWTSWVESWLKKCRYVLKEGAPVLIFTDWRQLPSLTDAFQHSGLVWRGVFSWVKPSGRPTTPGRFVNSAEYVVWGSKGDMPINRKAIQRFISGYYIGSAPRDRVHITQKPLELLRQLVRICKPKGRVLDPFCGSGTTLEACVLEGLDCVGVDIDGKHLQNTIQRLKKVEK